MSFLAHRRAHKRLSLLVYDALDARERAETLRHLETCPHCTQELGELRELRARFDLDPLRGAEPPVPVEFLLARVKARIDAPPAPARARWILPLTGAAAAAIAALVFVFPNPPSPTPAVAPAPEVSEEALLRLERSVAREQAARYLSDAGDVLVSVAAAHDDCDKREDRVEVGEASARSRDLLARRALLVEADRAEVASALPVLEDVEHALREVAALPSCVRAVEVKRFRDQVEKRQLLMKIRLMTGELEG